MPDGILHRLLPLTLLGLLACTHQARASARRVRSLRQPPPAFESDVADNLFWMTEPPGARFDVPALQPGHRYVLFPKPGTYQVWARSAYPTDGKSNVVTVTVRQ